MVAAFPAAPAAKSPPVPIPTSREAADELLHELGRLDAIEARNEADLKREVAALTRFYSARNRVIVGGLAVAIADRRVAIDVALEAYAQAHKDELISEKKRSVKLNFGTLSWRKQSDGLEPVDGQSNAGRATLLDKLMEFIVEKLSTYPDLSEAAIQCLNPQISWRRPELLHAAQAKRIDAVELRRIGFKVVEGEDHFNRKPNPVDLSSQPASAA